MATDWVSESSSIRDPADPVATQTCSDVRKSPSIGATAESNPPSGLPQSGDENGTTSIADRALSLKDAGNKLLADGNLDGSELAYKQALRLLDAHRSGERRPSDPQNSSGFCSASASVKPASVPPSQQSPSKEQQIKVSVLLNLALLSMKGSSWNLAVDYANAALAEDPQSRKAL